jgi:hypothetical protein
MVYNVIAFTWTLNLFSNGDIFFRNMLIVDVSIFGSAMWRGLELKGTNVTDGIFGHLKPSVEPPQKTSKVRILRSIGFFFGIGIGWRPIINLLSLIPICMWNGAFPSKIKIRDGLKIFEKTSFPITSPLSKALGMVLGLVIGMRNYLQILIVLLRSIWLGAAPSFFTFSDGFFIIQTQPYESKIGLVLGSIFGLVIGVRSIFSGLSVIPKGIWLGVIPELVHLDDGMWSFSDIGRWKSSIFGRPFGIFGGFVGMHFILNFVSVIFRGAWIGVLPQGFNLRDGMLGPIRQPMSSNLGLFFGCTIGLAIGWRTIVDFILIGFISGWYGRWGRLFKVVENSDKNKTNSSINDSRKPSIILKSSEILDVAAADGESHPVLSRQSTRKSIRLVSNLIPPTIEEADIMSTAEEPFTLSRIPSKNYEVEENYPVTADSPDQALVNGVIEQNETRAESDIQHVLIEKSEPEPYHDETNDNENTSYHEPIESSQLELKSNLDPANYNEYKSYSELKQNSNNELISDFYPTDENIDNKMNTGNVETKAEISGCTVDYDKDLPAYDEEVSCMTATKKTTEIKYWTTFNLTSKYKKGRDFQEWQDLGASTVLGGCLGFIFIGGIAAIIAILLLNFLYLPSNTYQSNKSGGIWYTYSFLPLLLIGSMVFVICGFLGLLGIRNVFHPSFYSQTAFPRFMLYVWNPVIIPFIRLLLFLMAISFYLPIYCTWYTIKKLLKSLQYMVLYIFLSEKQNFIPIRTGGDIPQITHSEEELAVLPQTLYNKYYKLRSPIGKTPIKLIKAVLSIGIVLAITISLAIFLPSTNLNLSALVMLTLACAIVCLPTLNKLIKLFVKSKRLSHLSSQPSIKFLTHCHGKFTRKQVLDLDIFIVNKIKSARVGNVIEDSLGPLRPWIRDLGFRNSVEIETKLIQDAFRKSHERGKDYVSIHQEDSELAAISKVRSLVSAGATEKGCYVVQKYVREDYSGVVIGIDWNGVLHIWFWASPFDFTGMAE